MESLTSIYYREILIGLPQDLSSKEKNLIYVFVCQLRVYLSTVIDDHSGDPRIDFARLERLNNIIDVLEYLADRVEETGLHNRGPRLNAQLEVTRESIKLSREAIKELLVLNEKIKDDKPPTPLDNDKSAIAFINYMKSLGLDGKA